MMMFRRALLGAALLLAPLSAYAQSNYPSVGGATVPATVQECLNSSGVAVPVSSGTCANAAQVAATLSGAGANNADAVASVATGLTPVQAYGFVYNGTTWDRAPGTAANGAKVDTELPAAAAAADASANPTAPFVLGANELYNGTTWDRWRSALGTTGVGAVNTEGTKATYSAGATVVPAAAATDVFTITGSGTKTIRVTRIQVSGQATATTPVAFQLIKRSTADTAGTSGAVTAVPLDSGSAAATATLLNYTANPTLGNTVGTIRQQQMTLIAASTPAVPNVPIVWDFATRNTQGAVLRGTAQVLALNFVSQTVAGNALQVDIEWTEE